VPSADVWDPGAYLRGSFPRTRAVLDLLARVDHAAPRLIADLGCGPGNNTELIAARWPDAYVLGIDSSPAMIAAARSRERPGRLEFREADVLDWQPDEPPDVLLLNAVLQWIPDHMDLVRRLARLPAPGGVLAFQQPRPLAGGLTEIAAEVAGSPAWRGRVAPPAPVTAYAPIDYLTVLGDAGLRAEAWETTALYPLAGEGALAEYATGAVLRSVLSGLEPAVAGQFLAALADRLREVSPPRVIGGTRVEILRQRRVFAVGRRD
jgi:trans-aconitate 2-methyltransferase